jgi:hypothetical protein
MEAQFRGVKDVYDAIMIEVGFGIPVRVCWS